MAKRSARSLTTLAEVAAAAEVSIASASKVLRGIDRGTSPATRTRILAAAERLGYRRNLLVEGMQTGRSLTIGVVVPPYGEFTRRLADAIHAQCLRDGLIPIFHWASPVPRTGPDAEEADARDERDVLDRLLNRRVDGLILYPAADGALRSHLDECRTRGIPLVAIDRCPDPDLCDFIGTDDRDGILAAMVHLVGLGHRHFLHLGGEQRYATYRQRATLTAEAAAAAGGTCHRHDIPNADLHRLLDHARAALAAAPQATAVTLGSDVFAPALYRAAQEAGRPIGQRLSVLGFAGLDLGLHLDPPLSTVAQDPAALGRQATRLLSERLRDGPQPPRRVILPATLTLRASTGAP